MADPGEAMRCSINTFVTKYLVKSLCPKGFVFIASMVQKLGKFCRTMQTICTTKIVFCLGKPVNRAMHSGGVNKGGRQSTGQPRLVLKKYWLKFDLPSKQNHLKKKIFLQFLTK